MATRYLVAGSTDFGASASWASTRYGAGGAGVPTAGDDVFILDGNQAIDTNLDALSGVDLDSFTVGNGFSGNIGAPGSSLELEGTAFTITPGRGGFHYYNLSGTGADDVLVDAAGSARIFFTAGTVTLLKARSGDIEIQNGCDTVTIHNSGAFIDAAYDATAITTYNQTGGNSRIRRAVTTGRLTAGRVQLTEDSNAVSHGTIDVHGSLVDLAVSGTVTTANLYAGRMAPETASSSPAITTLNRIGGTFVSKIGSTSITVGTDNDLGGKTMESPKGVASGFGTT